MSKLYGGLSAIKDGILSFDEVLLYYTDVPLQALFYETKKNKRKAGKNMARIINQPTVDLRGFTPEALRKIKSIVNVASVLLPEDMPEGFSEAYTQIKKMNVAGEIRVPDSAQFFNGSVYLSRQDVTADSVIMCNGIVFVRDIPEEMNVRMIVNGTLIKAESAFVTVSSINGTKVEVSDDVQLIKGKAELNFDKGFADNISEKTIIVACGKIHISDEITEEMLSAKQVKFIAAGKIFAREELHGYINANSDAVGKILTEEKKGNREKKKLFRWK